MSKKFSNQFKKYVKKSVDRTLKVEIRDNVNKIEKTPQIGSKLKGDLKKFHEHKFTHDGQQYRIAYHVKGDQVIFDLVGTRENFQDDLRIYAKSTRY